jgi:hypothetical protein
MKGLLFGGCSFTWGQGLYFYSDLPNLYNPPPYEYHGDKVTDAHKKFTETIRYPRLVANHFKTFEVFKNNNGGSEDETFDFFKNIFNDPKKINLQSHISYERYTYNDFSYIIIQLSQLYRNKFYFEIDGKKFWSNVPPNANWGDVKNLLNWLDKNNYTIDDWKEHLLKQQHERLINELKFYEEKGIKTKILTWEDDLLNHIKNDSFLNSRFIQLHHNNEVFDTIQQLQGNYKEMYIEHDPYFEGYVYNDHHPSKLCHQVIANSIIKNIENKFL